MHNEYLGDGVYASFDGYHVNLATNHHDNHVVALEPNVVNKLREYFARVDEELAKANNRSIKTGDQ